jgi:hypothetical protein
VNKPVNITFNIHANDAHSFRRSQQQLMTRAVGAVARRRALDRGKLNAILAVGRDPELFAKAPAPIDWGKVVKTIKAILAGKDDWK